jgi:hypothetical protein
VIIVILTSFWNKYFAAGTASELELPTDPIEPLLFPLKMVSKALLVSSVVFCSALLDTVSMAAFSMRFEIRFNICALALENKKQKEISAISLYFVI